MALSMRIVGVLVEFFNEAGKTVQEYRIIGPDQNLDEVIGDAFTYQCEYEISGEVDTILPDGMTISVSIKDVCKYGRRIYRHGEVWSKERILQMQDGNNKNYLLKMMEKHQCRHVAILVINNKRRAFPFFQDRDILDVPDLEIQTCETNDE